MDAVEEAQWEGLFDKSVVLEFELYYINGCISKGSLYEPLF